MESEEQYCKGPWVHSARNIKYNVNILECELAAINGKWIKNKLQFFPQYEYINNNGRFEWDNCRNGVELNNYSHENICRRYKQINIQVCLDNLTNDYDNWFEIEKKYIKSFYIYYAPIFL